MYAVIFLYITGILSGLNFMENKQEMALSSSIVFTHNLSFPFLLLHDISCKFYCFPSLDYKNKLHFGDYDPLPSIYLCPVVRKGDVGHCFALSPPSLLTVSSFLPSTVYWGKREVAKPFTGLVLLLSIHWCPLDTLFTCVCSFSGYVFGCLEVFQEFLHCTVPWHKWPTYCDIGSPLLALAFSTLPYIFFLLGSPAVCCTICLTHRKFTMEIMLSLLLFFLAQ